jgi:hypothetical protein
VAPLLARASQMVCKTEQLILTRAPQMVRKAPTLIKNLGGELVKNLGYLGGGLASYYLFEKTSILAHELGHAAVGTLLGGHVDKINVSSKGGSCRFSRSPYLTELMNIAGPIAGATCAYGLGFMAKKILPHNSNFNPITKFCSSANIMLEICQLMPFRVGDQETMTNKSKQIAFKSYLNKHGLDGVRLVESLRHNEAALHEFFTQLNELEKIGFESYVDYLSNQSVLDGACIVESLAHRMGYHSFICPLISHRAFYNIQLAAKLTPLLPFLLNSLRKH